MRVTIVVATGVPVATGIVPPPLQIPHIRGYHSKLHGQGRESLIYDIPFVHEISFHAPMPVGAFVYAHFRGLAGTPLVGEASYGFLRRTPRSHPRAKASWLSYIILIPVSRGDIDR